MNKLYIHIKYLLIGLMALAACSCQEDDGSIFPDDRLSAEEHIVEMNKVFQSAPHGWKTILNPGVDGVGGYNMVVKFKADGTCDMVSDYYEHDSGYGTDPFDGSTKQSGIIYRIKKVTNFELSFETFSFIHKLYEMGASRTSQYRIAEYSSEEIVLWDGNSKMVMTPATQSDWDMNSYLEQENIFKDYSYNTILFNYMHKGDAPKIQISISFRYRSISFYFYDDTNSLQRIDTGYNFNKEGIVLQDSVDIKGLGLITKMKFDGLEEGTHGSKILNLTLDRDIKTQLYSSVLTMVPVDDGIEHFLKIKGSSLAEGGRFWASRARFEGGFRYNGETTYFGLEDNVNFVEFSIYLEYFNSNVKDTYNTFTFAFQDNAPIEYFNVYFLYEKVGTDRVIFRLDTEKGNGGYSSYIHETLKAAIEPMINKLIQPEGFLMVSNPYANSVDGSLSMYMVDDKEDGFIAMKTGTLH